jgi:hypothetical protein
MLNYPAIRSFLSTHHGYYCADCMAALLNLSAADIRRSMGHQFAEVTSAYRLCRRCLDEQVVFALRASA